MRTPDPGAGPPVDVVEYVGLNGEGGRLLREIDWSALPRHVAVIMDGNGRWARARDRSRVDGHRAGVEAVREVVELSARAGLEALTLYAFSRENWARPADEVEALMSLCREYVLSELEEIRTRGIRFETIGRDEDLPRPVREAVAAAREATARNDGLRFTIALSYGGRTEMVDAVRAALADLRSGALDLQDLDESRLAGYLYTSGLPDPDLLIRTSGEMRVSNFLLYQIAYAEIWVSEKLWPDFRRTDLLSAIADYQGRERRFGAVPGDPSTRPRRGESS
jgi:undecaprenyl diphosphate synthase